MKYFYLEEEIPGVLQVDWQPHKNNKEICYFFFDFLGEFSPFG